MFHKAIRHTLLLLILATRIQAQNLTQSPYSVVGLGDMQFQGNAQQSSMGQVNQAYRKPFEVNIGNPASYSALQQTVFEAGYMYASGSLATATASTKVDNSSFSYFTFGVPVSQKRGISLVSGLLPYSSTGYNVRSTKLYPGIPAYYGTTQMEGRGGISRFLLGTSLRLHPNLSIGINASYLFGTMERNQQLLFDTALHKFNIAEERKFTINDVVWQIGLQYHKSLNDKYKLDAGMTAGLGKELRTVYSYTNRSLGWGGTSQYTIDTNATMDNVIGNITLPMTLSGGIAFEKKGHWMIEADVNMQHWSTYKAFGVSDQLKDWYGVALGASIVPDMNSPLYTNKIEYRAGAGFNTGNVNINGKAISGYNVSAGFGFPMGKSNSRFNLTMEYLSRGTTESGLVRENMLRFMVGITFSDQWFMRYRYD